MGLTRVGSIGLVELGIICCMRFPAGKSYQGRFWSPCIAGIVNGTSLADLAATLDTALESESAGSFVVEFDRWAASTACRILFISLVG
jgi:hypothetical protein